MSPFEELQVKLNKEKIEKQALRIAISVVVEENQDLKRKLSSWLDVFGHLGTPEEVGKMWYEVSDPERDSIPSFLFPFIHNHYLNTESLRLGQRFCNEYLSGPWPELYYADDDLAVKRISKWLRKYQYISLPTEKRSFV